ALSLPEALTLAVLPQDPERRLRGQTGNEGFLNARLKNSRNRLYRHWLTGDSGDAALQGGFDLPLTIRPLARLPFEAPHAVEHLMAARRAAGGGEPRVT